MPELPEVETIRLQLNESLKDLMIVKIEILSPKNFIGSPEEVIGKTIMGVERRAKIILIELTDSNCLAIHLKMTGQLIYRDKQDAIGNKKNKEKIGHYDVSELPNKYTRVIIEFNEQSRLYFNDLRKFGWMKIIKIINGCLDLPELDKLGPEAIDEKDFSLEYFQKILSKSKKAVKLILLDQEKLAGVGNIYANEALFQAGILPTRPANQLKENEIKKLRQAIIKTLKSALGHHGTSDKDEAYRQISGEKGKHQHYLRVYAREKQSCSKCGGEIKRVKIGGRGSFYCPNCQF